MSPNHLGKLMLLLACLQPWPTDSLEVGISEILKTECHADFYCRPKCLDRPEGYYCECGPGFFWNSHSCVSQAVDSSLVFSNRANASYAVINNRTRILPTLYNFSIVLYFKLYHLNETGTLFSFRKDSHGNYVRLWYNAADRQFHIEAYAERQMNRQSERPAFNQKFQVPNLQAHQWYHLSWTNLLHRDQSTEWRVYVRPPDGPVKELINERISRRGEGVVLPNRTELYLGQNSPNASNYFDMRYAFLGEISHFNVWNETLGRDEADTLSKDDIHRYCGNQIEWSDLRYGTRGNVTLKWPSGIQFGQVGAHSLHAGDQAMQKLVKRLQETCDYNCSVEMGAQCKAGIESNIEWPRTKSGHSTSVPCPSADMSENMTASGFASIAYRSCSKNDKQQGVWGEPNYDRCVSLEHLDILNESRTIRNLGQNCQLVFSDLMSLLRRMENLTRFAEYRNPMDLHVMVEGLKNVAMAWIRSPCQAPRKLTSDLKDLKLMFNTILQIGDNLMSERNMAAWNLTRHPGQECWHLISTLHHVYSLYVSDLQGLKFVHGCKSSENCPDGSATRRIEFSDLFSFFSGDNIIVKVTAFDPDKFNGDALPDKDDEKKMRQNLVNLGAVGIQVDTFRNHTFPPAEDSLTSHDIQLSPTVYICILAVYPFGDRLLPHVHLTADWKKTLGSAARVEDNLNSAIYHVLLFKGTKEISDGLTVPVRTRLKYANKVNISDIKCVRLSFHDINQVTMREDTHWTTNDCWLEHEGTDYAQCACNSTGLQGLTTDMYNNNSNRTKEVIKLLAYPSYIGCGVSSILCLTTCVLLTYFRTSSNTAKIHQNFSLAIVCGQLVFVFGIDKVKPEALCHSMAIFIHYFFLASFSWLMNEAFNLYIVITYAAHAHQDGSEEGGMWRYYLIGWIVPIAFVGTFVGINGNSYYAVDMCWTANKNVWLYAGPAIGIVAITVMVLTFTAKEHHESSYTKDEKANKAITIHSKALWTQVILLSVAWYFAFVSIVMHDIIVKLLFAMFNCLQGIFFIVFYFLLNDEVQNKYMQNQKMRLLALHGLHDTTDEGDQTELRLMQAAVEDIGDDAESNGESQQQQQTPKQQQQRRQKQQQQQQLRSSASASSGRQQHQQLRKRNSAAAAAASASAASTTSGTGGGGGGGGGGGAGSSVGAGSGEENSDCEMIVTSV